MRYLDEQAIEYITLGAAFLGTGGGGDPYNGKLMAIAAIRKYGPVQLITAEDVPDDALVIPVAGMGAPSVSKEKLPNGSEFSRTFDALSRYIGKDVFATIPIEAGGMNSMVPIIVAAERGLPMVDGDGMGRAFPELQMVTFHLEGVSSTPLALTDARGNIALLETVDNNWSERLARNLTVEMGATTQMAIYPMTGAQMKRAAIRNVVTLSEEIGKVIAHAPTLIAPLTDLLKITNGKELFNGKIIDVLRETRAGFNFGTIRLEGLDKFKNKHMEVFFQNENLVAVIDGKAVALTPDLIALVHTETLMPVTTEALKYGMRVHVLGLPCDDAWRTPKGIETAGPRYFGYPFDYIPLENLTAEEDETHV